MNRKGFANIILIILVVILAGAVGYFAFMKKPAPVVEQITPPATTLPPANTVSQNQPPTSSGKEISGLVSFTIPLYCSFTLDTPAGSSVSGEKGWIIDCGRTTKNDARGFMGKILEPQGWKFCDSQTASAHWWKNGVITGVVESENNSSATSYPFHVSQRRGAECESTTSSSNTSVDQKILACYQENVIPNNSVQRVTETTRRFVNVPKDLYPKEISSYFKTVSGNATAGWISNGGLPGEGLDATPECWSTYYEFDGNGEVDLRVKSTKNGVPDYFVRFVVGPTQ